MLRSEHALASGLNEDAHTSAPPMQGTLTIPRQMTVFISRKSHCRREPGWRILRRGPHCLTAASLNEFPPWPTFQYGIQVLISRR